MPGLPTDPLRRLQWYISDADYPVATVDLNVLPVWQDYTGRGVHVGVYDTLVEASHPDLAANYDAALQVDGLDYVSIVSSHGTAVAGVIAAAANGVGPVGVAHGARITSMPVIFSSSIGTHWLDTAMAVAGRFDVINMSYGGNTAFDTYLGPAGWAPFARHYAAAADHGRGGLGTSLVAAAGNSRTGYTDANLSYFQTERHTLVVGAVGTTGMVAEYSSPGASLLVVAPSTDGFLSPGVTTTDRSGVEGSNAGNNPGYEPVSADYTTHFGGTSAAAPMVAGIAALMLEANGALGWRDVREILAITARHTGSAIGAVASVVEGVGWSVNAATRVNGGGFHFSNNYGFGLVDALGAVRLAETWQVRQNSANEAVRAASVAGKLAVPSGAPLSVGFEMAAGVVAEGITLALDLSHAYASHLEIALISPSGTTSTLFSHQRPPPGAFPSELRFRPWTFVSNAFRGEDATGTWRVTITDSVGLAAPGTLNSATLTVFGASSSDDDTYFYTNEFASLAGVAHGAVLADSAGVDTINAAAVTSGSVINLRGGVASQVNGKALGIGAGTVIENAIGGDGDDLLVGNAAANHLQGGRGADVIEGREGEDWLEGGAGRDSLAGGAGADRLEGGADVDVLRGNAGADELLGGDGNDWLEGGADGDTLRGGAGQDVASYVGSAAGVTVSLVIVDALTGQQFAAGGDAAGDLLFEMENIRGSSHDDMLTGDGQANSISGGAGADTIDGGGGNDIIAGGIGADTLRGGAGGDMVSYIGSAAAVAVGLGIVDGVSGRQAAAGGDAEGDRLFGFEHVVGSDFGDTIEGDGAVNVLWGRDGADRIDGGGGNDWIEGGAGDDVLIGGAGIDAFVFQQADLRAPGFAAGVDRIVDFHPLADPGVERDRIRLLAIDAIAGLGDDAFSFIGGAAFSAAGQLRVFYDGTDTIIEGNTVASMVGGVESFAELRIILAGSDVSGLLTAADFAL